jgi:hypothetical protein
MPFNFAKTHQTGQKKTTDYWKVQNQSFPRIRNTYLIKNINLINKLRDDLEVLLSYQRHGSLSLWTLLLLALRLELLFVVLGIGLPCIQVLRLLQIVLRLLDPLVRLRFLRRQAFIVWWEFDFLLWVLDFGVRFLMFVLELFGLSQSVLLHFQSVVLQFFQKALEFYGFFLLLSAYL